MVQADPHTHTHTQQMDECRFLVALLFCENEITRCLLFSFDVVALPNEMVPLLNYNVYIFLTLLFFFDGVLD